jgi:hypothetical protein
MFGQERASVQSTNDIVSRTTAPPIIRISYYCLVRVLQGGVVAVCCFLVQRASHVVCCADSLQLLQVFETPFVLLLLLAMANDPKDNSNDID